MDDSAKGLERDAKGLLAFEAAFGQLKAYPAADSPNPKGVCEP